ncbi:phage baseplate assembly protein V [Deinococcus metalli]|uniref:Phage baseplate assembly protein V n=1 Tax=Deinococcus metalli TaxID=1141878 RepID=A0A7W8KGT9_9DEIO|nr:phage baseplate assembly protein V [Deinococcus metalli]MBB5376756.1 phage baseplate assembly protein V [Deinococcus metalli]GHF45123.1 type IV secretion protein Rhs [Deinococcus metalli]
MTMRVPAFRQTAALRVRLAGQSLDGWEGVVHALRIMQRLSLPAACELVLRGPGPLPAQPGDPLTVDDADGQTVFGGEVSAVAVEFLPGGTREVRVRAYDPLQRLRRSQTARVRADVDLHGLAQELAAGLGLGVQVDVPILRRSWGAQVRQSDFDALRRVSERSGRAFRVQGGQLDFVGPAGDGSVVTLRLGQALLEARVERSVDPACDAVEVRGWNPLTVQAVQGRAVGAGSGVARQVVGVQAENDEEARWLAQAELDWRAAAAHTCWGVSTGDSRLRPGGGVRLEGLGDGLEGDFVLTEVTHRVETETGFVTEFSSAPVVPPPSPVPVATFGTVAQVDDPQALGRVRVTLPAQGDLESGWLHVLSLAAGPDRGLMALPDVGDTVLVLLPAGDGSSGVVLGGLYGPSGMPDSGVESGATRRYTLRTAAGQQVVLDAAAGLLRLEDGRGSVVELTPDGLRVHAATRLVLEAPGQEVLIRGQRINFERA